MSIDRVNISHQGIDRPQAALGNELVRNSEKEGQVKAGTDSVALSAKAREMDRLRNAVEHSRSERLNEVRLALQSGTYRVSAEDIAKSLIDANTRRLIFARSMSHGWAHRKTSPPGRRQT
jgi:flagellar biosynthesis anti-sigma factor FlgM